MFEECCHSQVCRKNAVLHDNELSFFFLCGYHDASFRLQKIYDLLSYFRAVRELHTQLPEDHVHPAVSVRSNTVCASAALRSSSSTLPSSLAHRHAPTAACTSRRSLIPITTGILPEARATSPNSAARTDHATATAATSS